MTLPDQPGSEDILILGIGNPLMGDDGAGIRAVQMLADCALPAHVWVKEAGMPGWGLPSWLEGWTTVILVDAVKMGQAPGTWRKFRMDEVQVLMEKDTLSLHQPDLASGLALTQALDIVPQNLLLYGIEPADTSPGKPISQVINDNLPNLVESILDDLRRKQI